MSSKALVAAVIAAGIAVAALGPAPAQERGAAPQRAKASHHRPYSDLEHWVPILEDPKRDEWQRPLDVVTLLGVHSGDVVADLGAGTGYFTIYLAVMVGEHGRVYAVDTEQAMLDHIKARDDIEQEVVVPVLATADDPKLPPGEIDLVLVVNTWHHIKSRRAYLPRLQRALAAGGRVVIVDFREGDLPVGPPPAERIPRDAVVREFEEAGWKLVAESVALPYQYLLTFYPPKPKEKE